MWVRRSFAALEHTTRTPEIVLIERVPAGRPERRFGALRVYHGSVNGVTVFILAGGRSTRMGADKALLALDGKTLLERGLETARAVGGEAMIVGARERYAEFGATVVEDEFQQCGPLGGIHAALGASQSELNVVLSVDTPLVSAEFLRYLLKRAQEKPDALATVPDAAGGVQ